MALGEERGSATHTAVASLINRSGTWYASFQDSKRIPSKRRHSLKTRSRRTAERMLAKLDDAYNMGAYDPWSESPADYFHAEQTREPKRIREAIEDFLRARSDELSPYTLRNYRSALGILASSLGDDRVLDRVSTHDVKRFLTAEGQRGVVPSSGTQGFRLIAAKSFFSWCSEHEHMKVDPATVLRPPRQDERLPRTATDEDVPISSCDTYQLDERGRRRICRV